jgi:flagellar motility protein MotE (MotC chaperone)
MNMLRNPWILAVLAVVLGVGAQAAFFVVKLGGMAGGHGEEEEHAGPTHTPTYAPPTLSWNFVTPAIDELGTELRTRVAAVERREKELEDYQRRLEAERAELEKLKIDLDEIRKGLEARRDAFMATVLEVKEGEEKNLKTLAATYTTLTPPAALAIFREMDDDTVVKILAFMKPDPVGQILEEMARTRDGDATLAPRAAAISNKLRLKRQVPAEEGA